MKSRYIAIAISIMLISSNVLAAAEKQADMLENHSDESRLTLADMVPAQSNGMSGSGMSGNMGPGMNPGGQNGGAGETIQDVGGNLKMATPGSGAVNNSKQPKLGLPPAKFGGGSDSTHFSPGAGGIMQATPSSLPGGPSSPTAGMPGLSSPPSGGK